MRAFLLLTLLACTRETEKPDVDTAEEAPGDRDGDGMTTAEGDCDDGDAATYPGAPESCDGNDQDCDGTVDEDVTATWYADADGDGFGDPVTVFDTCEPPRGAVAVAGDCDDRDVDVNPAAVEACNGADDDCDGEVDEDDRTPWYVDADGDGFGDPVTERWACAPGPSELPDGTDCDDTVDTVYPGAPETCDEADNDCDGVVDEGVTTLYFADRDGDGHGDAGLPQPACALPLGYTWDALDCDDASADVSPSALESCNGIDDDCDGATDEDDATDAPIWYTDADADGWGDAPVRACALPAGASGAPGDCDDARADVSPSASETCNAIDDDCDGLTDEDDAADAAIWYADTDGDGYGDLSSVTAACAAPAGFVADATDCDDARGSVSPAGVETCDGRDDDCDGAVDEPEAFDARVWYADADFDGYGDVSVTTAACDAPAGFVGNDDDCDDALARVNPAAAETCDGRDDDCDGAIDEPSATDASTWYADADGDSFGDAGSPTRACAAPGGSVADATDCDDAAASVSPAGFEACNAVDDDCDGAVDEGAASGAGTWYTDADADGYGGSASTLACSPPAGSVATPGDCDDTTAAVSPADVEACNGIDDDCDGATDESGATGETTWYLDGDGDGWGSASSTTRRCTRPSGYVAVAGDCDDSRGGAYPGATETCNGVDDDCDGTADEGFSATCDDLSCSGSGLIHTIPDGCMDDGGGSSGGDGLQVYCVSGIARFCLTGESCPWRASPTFDDGTTCERSGLGSDFMANAWCSLWNGHASYRCTSSEDVYF
jgi:hypothetical protein